MNNIIQNLKNNWQSGLTVGLVSIPIAVSLAVASNASPLAGIITAVWAGFIASLFGGSNYNIIGPTGALAGLLLTNASVYGPDCLPILAILSGIIIWFAFLCRLERYLIFIPGSALQGFILGVALVIVCGQLNSALGIPPPQHHGGSLDNAYHALRNITSIHFPAFFTFLGALIGLLFCARFTPRFPGAILLTPFGITLGYLSTIGTFPWYIKTLGSLYTIQRATLAILPSWSLWSIRVEYLFASLSIAGISIIETMISARIADGITKTKHNKRKELFGLALANIICGMAGGFPATAALARTALNIRSGSSHKLSATISSICVAACGLFCLEYFAYMPLPIIAALLTFVALRMLEMDHLIRLFYIDKKNFLLALIVAATTIYGNAIIGMLFGAVIAMLLLMEKLAAGYHDIMIKKDLRQTPIAHNVAHNKDTLIYSIKGPLAYINAQAHIARFQTTELYCAHVILNLQEMHFIDLDGVDALGEIIQIIINKQATVYIASISPVIGHLIEQNQHVQYLKNNGRIFAHVQDVLNVII